MPKDGYKSHGSSKMGMMNKTYSGTMSGYGVGDKPVKAASGSKSHDRVANAALKGAGPHDATYGAHSNGPAQRQAKSYGGMRKISKA